jgi:hypothetical protein
MRPCVFVFCSQLKQRIQTSGFARHLSRQVQVAIYNGIEFSCTFRISKLCCSIPGKIFNSSPAMVLEMLALEVTSGLR